MLDPRAPEHVIACAASEYIGRVRTRLAVYGQRTGAPGTPEELRASLDSLAWELQARPVAASVSLSGRIARMLDPAWWRRSLRRELLREAECVEHAQGRVRRSRDCYVSAHALRRLTERATVNRHILEGLEVCDETGVALPLVDVVDGSVSNPAVRRSELMVRCRGFEDVSKALSHEAVFLTLTCPSRFHRFDAAGKENPRWKGATPKQAQEYLCNLWAKIRAEWKRRGFAPYGFRIAEPHHDGCPHWHLLLFAPAHHVGWFIPRRAVAGRADAGAGLLGVAGAYALADCGAEPGALRHRFRVERIDPAKGSAVGYIAKYISKNVDGAKADGGAVGLDFASGKNATDASRRVRAWASTWGIRQFQQIGGPSVTVWRELRRLARDVENPALQLEVFEGVTIAADRGLWGLFWFLQGGPDVARRDLTHRPVYVAEGTGRYGDEQKRVRGVAAPGSDGRLVPALTRPHVWTVQIAGKAATDADMADWRYRHRLAKRLGFDSVQAQEAESAELDAELDRAIAEAGLPRSGAEGDASTWTRVNNCTVEPDPDFADSLVQAVQPVAQHGKIHAFGNHGVPVALAERRTSARMCHAPPGGEHMVDQGDC